MNRQEPGNFSYGDFLHCLQVAEFEGDPGNREIDTRIKRLVVTIIRGKKWFFEIREEIESVIVVGITINTQYYSTYKQKSRLLLHIFAHCQLDDTASESGKP